jgi:hypothetical protein
MDHRSSRPAATGLSGLRNCARLGGGPYGSSKSPAEGRDKRHYPGFRHKMNNFFGVTNLDENLLATVAPTRTFASGMVIKNPADWLVIWRSVATEKAKGTVLGFYLSDDRLEPLMLHPEKYAIQFARAGIGAIVEPDFSQWVNDPEEKQLLSVRQKKIVSRIFQSAGLRIVPNLNWGSPASYCYSFAGIPVGAPLVACECRTAGSCDDDRRAFLDGLAEGVRQIRPLHVIVYGGQEHSFWLKERLPAGPRYTLLESFMTVRSRIRARQERLAKTVNQLNLFTGGELWAEEDHQAA